jgi:hypothetical protein
VDQPRLLRGDIDSDSGVDRLLGDDFVRRLDRWVAEMRSDDAAAARARERWLFTQAQESSTFTGVLVDLSEQGTTVLIEGRSARRHRGRIVVVAHDFCALRTQAGHDVLLSYAGIASVRPEPRSTAPTGDRAVHLEAKLDDALGILAEDRPRVLVVTLAGDNGMAGELRSVGRDVLTLRLDGDPPAPAYIAISAIAELRPAD